MKRFYLNDNNKSNIVKSLYFLIIASLSLISLSLAWFFNGAGGDVDGFNFISEDAPHVLISVDDESYIDSDLEIADIGSCLFTPISGTGVSVDGNVQLWKPDSIDDDTSEPDFSSNTYADSDSYLTIDLYVQTSNISQIVLESSSKVEPCDTTARKSTFSDFSRDYIAGAVRVSFSVVTGETGNESETLKTIWAPNPTYELSSTVDNFVETLSFTETGTPETSYSYYNGTEIVVGTSVTSSANATIYEMSDDEKENTTVHFRIRVWVEGTDREAHTALSGGLFNMSLRLKSIAVEE